MERAVAPADCALAIAIPLTFEEFIRDVHALDKDFARSVVSASGRAAEAAWQEVYCPKVVELCTRVVERARSTGVTVVARATVAALSDLLERFPVVTLLAHSVLSAVRSSDLLAPREILATIQRGGSLVALHLRHTFQGEVWETDEELLRRHLARVLDTSLDPTRAWYGSTVRTDSSGRPAFHLNRVMLEDCFGPAMRRAPTLELHDGVKAMDELLTAIPRQFAGVLDLSVCNSVALGESIKRRRSDCLVVENVFLARIDIRLVRYALVLARLAVAPARYTDALAEVSRHLIK